VCVESGRPDDGPVRVYVTAESSCLVRRVRAVGGDNVESGWLARAEAGTPRVACSHTGATNCFTKLSPYLRLGTGPHLACLELPTSAEPVE
jgi:hypothetical protein